MCTSFKTIEKYDWNGDIKNRIIDLSFYLQRFMKNESKNNMLHTIIEGSQDQVKQNYQKY